VVVLAVQVWLHLSQEVQLLTLAVAVAVQVVELVQQVVLVAVVQVEI
jgi:hypothetical protein